MIRESSDKQDTLWYRQPASTWLEALPVGNGRMGAMVCGGIDEEVIDLSEATFMSGRSPDTPDGPGHAGIWYEIRQALLDSNYVKAESLADSMKGDKGQYGTNLPVGRLVMTSLHGLGDPCQYERSLDLEQGLALTRWTCSDSCISYERQIFLSRPHQVLVIRCTGPDLALSVALDAGSCPSSVRIQPDGDLTAIIQARETVHSDGLHGSDMYVRLRIITHQGHLASAGSSLQITGTDEMVLLLAMNTNFSCPDPEELIRKQIDHAAQMSWQDLLDQHIADFAPLIRSAGLELGSQPDSPTDQRLAAVQAGHVDEPLFALLLQYGRYLLASSSRPDSPLPAHLQGVWNDGIASSIGWTCDMHLDINTEMNYWPSLTTGLTQTAMPLYEWITNRLVPSGRMSARHFYGLPGWVAHTVSNGWGYTAPGWAYQWGFFPTAGVWIALHLWDHYVFTLDETFLRRTAWPVLHEAAIFFLHYVSLGQDRETLVPSPSYSPENSFLSEGRAHYLSAGATAEVVLIRELFLACLRTIQLTGPDHELEQQISNVLERLPAFQIGRRGQLQEWIDDYEEAVPNHRHMSHLLAVYPFAQISRDTPALLAAARKSIDERLADSHVWEATGWSVSLLVLFAARMHDGAWSHQHLTQMARNLARTNLMVVHPALAGSPSDVYELDGNTGLVAGIVEMMLQSQHGRIDLLPALPDAWPSGRVWGLRARGGLTVEIIWQDCKLTRAVVAADRACSCVVRYKGTDVKLDLESGESKVLEHTSF